MSQDIHAPYHFVPHAKQVIMPDWAHLVSHDVPFEKGLSGALSITLKNETPLCVGGRQDKKDGEPAQVLWAKDPMGNPTIPGSSLKGMIRNVMEIATLGKLNAVEDHQFSFRDITNNKYRNKVGTPTSGWIKLSNKGEWIFTPCSFARFKHSLLQDLFNIEIINDSNAEDKYKILPLSKKISVQTSSAPDKYDNYNVVNNNNSEAKKVEGNLVFLDNRVGKTENFNFSYFFHSPNIGEKQSVVSDIVTRLFSSYGEKNIQSLKDNPGALGIPVFAFKENQEITQLSFPKMPKLEYKNSIHNLIDNNSQTHLSESIFDFAELIFGTLRESALSLKSRVIFSDAIAHDSNAPLYSSNSLILNNPKPTFYPAYLEQPTQGSYNDYDDKSQLAGFKRYISKAPEYLELTENNVPAEQNNVASRLQLAPKDSTFTSRIVFHNLLPVELGALLWCLSLGNDDAHLHQLGHGKPYGAGAVKLNIDLNKIQENNPTEKAHTVESLMHSFSDYMNTAYNKDKTDAWLNSPQIQYLLALSDLKGNESVDTRYMSQDKSEFQNAKAAHKRLEPFNSLSRSNDDNKIQTSLAFGKGRLSKLTKGSDWEKESIVKRKAKEVRISQDLEQNNKEKKARAEREKIQKHIDSLPPGMAIIEKLKIDIKDQSKSNITVKIKEACQEFTNKRFSINEAEELNKIMRQKKYNKGNEKNKKAYKIFTEVYGIQN